ncbi:MAG: sulfite exporter TauE/SafE family protein [Myxococcales bacterium]|nr:sulfite exporter TauE/SafE family protein [Myxococcales bacterium]MCB9626368.1 sulfite exporter TauE/SafE family protein [Sandaracinaceae bacterium]
MELLTLDPLTLALAFGVTVIAAGVQGTVGFGFGIVSVPILILVDPRLAPVPQLCVQLPLTFMMLYRERKHADLRSVGYMTLGRLPGTALGMLLITVPEAARNGIIGMITLIAVALLSTERRVARNARTETAAGFFGGAADYLSAMGGPPLALLYKEDAGPTVRASLALAFSVGIVMTLGGRVVRGDFAALDLWLGLFLVVPTLLGLWLSRYTIGRVEGRPMRLSILIISGACALALLAKAIF